MIATNGSPVASASATPSVRCASGSSAGTTSSYSSASGSATRPESSGIGGVECEFDVPGAQPIE